MPALMRVSAMGVRLVRNGHEHGSGEICSRSCPSAARKLEQRTKPCSLDGCPMFAPAYMGRKRRAQPLPLLLLYWRNNCGQEQESSCNGVKAFEKSVFRPCTLGRTLIE